ncbi:hypothetical protein ABEF95_003339 [Exophiala dermatitidis]
MSEQPDQPAQPGSGAEGPPQTPGNSGHSAQQRSAAEHRAPLTDAERAYRDNITALTMLVRVLRPEDQLAFGRDLVARNEGEVSFRPRAAPPELSPIAAGKRPLRPHNSPIPMENSPAVITSAARTLLSIADEDKSIQPCDSPTPMDNSPAVVTGAAQKLPTISEEDESFQPRNSHTPMDNSLAVVTSAAQTLAAISDEETSLQPHNPPTSMDISPDVVGNATRTELHWLSDELVDLYQVSTDTPAPEIVHNLEILNQNRDDFTATIESGRYIWKAHRTFVSYSDYFRLEVGIRMNADNDHVKVILDPFRFTPRRVDLYLLWLYTFDYSVLLRWIDKVSPGEELRGAVDMLILSAIVRCEPSLTAEAEKSVGELFATNLWFLTDKDAAQFVKKTCDTIEHCLEMFFEQEAKDDGLERIRWTIMVEIFRKAGTLFPQHKKWLERWIGRSPYFKATFKAVRAWLLETDQIARSAPIPEGQHVELLDAACEEFNDIWDHASVQRQIGVEAQAGPSSANNNNDANVQDQDVVAGPSGTNHWNNLNDNTVDNENSVYPDPTLNRDNNVYVYPDPTESRDDPDYTASAGTKRRRVTFAEPEVENLSSGTGTGTGTMVDAFLGALGDGVRLTFLEALDGIDPGGEAGAGAGGLGIGDYYDSDDSDSGSTYDSSVGSNDDDDN